MNHYATGKERPATNRTPRTLSAWAAGTRLVSSAEQAGAPPLHDTEPEPRIDWTFSPLRPPTRTFDPSTANNHAAIQDQPAIEPTVVDVSPRIDPPHVLTRWVPWSLLIATPGVGLVWLTTKTLDPGSPVGMVAIASVLVCGALLVLAQVLDEIGTKR